MKGIRPPNKPLISGHQTGKTILTGINHQHPRNMAQILEQKTKFTFSSLLKFLLVLVLISESMLTHSQSLKFEHYRYSDGLPSDAITCSMQDQQGFLWIGTYQGLARFDGEKFKVYRYQPKNKKGLRGNMISCLYQDHNGEIWIGTASNGLSVFHPKKELFTHFSHGTADSMQVTNKSIRRIIEDSEKTMWIGTEDGLTLIDSTRKKITKLYYNPHNQGHTINGQSVYDMVEDESGVWLGTDNSELCYYNKKSKTFSDVPYTNLNLKKDARILKKLYLDNNHHLYVSSNKGGLSKLNIETGEYVTYTTQKDKGGLSTMKIRDIIQVDSLMWLATDGAGLDIFNPQTEVTHNYRNNKCNPHSLSSNVLWNISVDRQDNIWIGSYHGGINKYDPRNNYFHLLDHYSDYQANKPVLSLFRSNDTLWVGTDWGGLYALKDKKRIARFKPEKRFKNGQVIKSIAKDRTGKLLLGTYDQGLIQLNLSNNKITQFINAPELPSNNIWAIHTDSRGISWLATLGGGITVFDPENGRFSQPLIHYESSGQKHLYNIYEDAQSNLWFSSDDGILFYQRRTEQWKHFNIRAHFENPDPTINNVKAVVEDNLRNIWIATAAGLVKYIPSEEKWELFKYADGIPELPLINLTKDNFGNLVVVSKKYISLFDLSKEKAISYSITDNSLTHNSLVKTKNKIYIGGNSGITYFRPQSIRSNKTIPPVYFTQLKINNQPKDYSDNHKILNKAIEFCDTIHLNHHHNIVEFHFAALNFSDTKRNIYSYKLEGFDKEWVTNENKGSVTYTNLPPGKYTLRVKAANNHRVWNSKGAQVLIIVHPPFWDTIWFKALIILIIAGLIYVFIRMRIQHVRRNFENQQLKKEQEVNNLKNKNLKTELDSTKSELDNITMNYIYNNQKLQKIRNQIAETSKHTDSIPQKSIHHILKEIDREMKNNDYWDKFEHQFNKSHDNFLERFKQTYPDLSMRELRICAYLRMGLSNNEIATLMNVTTGTIATSRYRIRKKLKLEERKSLTKMILRF